MLQVLAVRMVLLARERERIRGCNVTYTSCIYGIVGLVSGAMERECKENIHTTLRILAVGTRPVQYFDNIVYHDIYSIVVIRCFPICYHDNCHIYCKGV